jgi:hypothetical protein
MDWHPWDFFSPCHYTKGGLLALGGHSLAASLQECVQMVRKLVCAMCVMTVTVGFVMAGEFTAFVTKVDGNKITYQRYKKKDKDGDPVTIEVAKDAKISFGKGAKNKFEATDDIKDGLKADVFAKPGDKGIQARITTDADDKKVTQILVLQKKAAQ